MLTYPADRHHFSGHYGFLHRDGAIGFLQNQKWNTKARRRSLQAGYKSPCPINPIQSIYCYLKLDFRVAGAILGRALFLKIPMFEQYRHTQTNELTVAVMGEYEGKRS